MMPSYVSAKWHTRLLRRSLLIVASWLSIAQVSAADRINVLWIVADDLSPELGCYGYEGVATPNIDRLAAEGTRYDHAYSSSPVCSASRTAFITGMYQTTVGGHHHRTWNMQPLPDGVKPITELFRDAGYFVCNGSGNGLATELRPGKIDYNFVFDKSTLFDGTDWRGRDPQQPFFAQVQIKEPHRPFVQANEERPGVKIPAFYPDHPVTRVDWGNYLASIEKLDQRVGKVIERLKEDNLYDSTAIFFFGDHGRPHVRGKQWLYDGGIWVPLIVKLPGGHGGVSDALVSLIDVPATSLSICGIDLPSTMQGHDFLSQAAPRREAIFAARDRCGDAFDRVRCVRTRNWKYIRNLDPQRSYSQMSGYKKLQYPVLTLMAVMHHDQGRLHGPQAEWFAATRPREELYDLANDPDELVNLATVPKHSTKLATMRARLDEWMSDTGDRGGEPEGDAAFIEANVAAKRAYYQRTMERRKLDPELSDRAYLDWWKRQLGLK